MAGAIASAVADAAFTFAWMMCVSTVGAATSIILSSLALEGIAPALLITTSFIFFLLLIFNPVADLLGGASFNPTGNAAFYAAGLGSDSLFSLALRFPAQAAGSAGGVLAIKELMPPQYKHTLSGPRLKVDMHTGAVAEGVLTFVITLAVLWIIVKGPRNPLIKTWLLASTTVTLVVAGSGYTGPSMNPANAFGWAYLNNRHNTMEQLYVYWICPFVGAILAAWVFRVLSKPPVKVKQS